ncbi:MAG: hypothetical protein IPJ56_07395 [Gemmatimonadetes bacterium]|nr:hypothetical protein [Gemmatimonadota bacterium]
MKQDAQVPLMTESNDIQAQFGNNGYSKPAAGLVMLREQVLGDSLFDEAFKEYSKKWMFKHPQPADFFRSIEDGAGEQLNYFWRGWFYTTYANDQSIAAVESQAGDSLLGPAKAGQTYYRVKIENKGGLVLPLQIEVTYDDGTKELVKLPADVWRRNELAFTYGFFSKKTVTQVVLDPKGSASRRGSVEQHVEEAEHGVVDDGRRTTGRREGRRGFLGTSPRFVLRVFSSSREHIHQHERRIL